MSEHPQVAIIILTWNGKQWLGPCLDSVLKTEYVNFRIYVVDNNSTDGTPALVKDKYHSVTIIQNQGNLGFAEGNNVGMRRALKDGADYIILLNQDTKVDPGWISPLVEASEEDPSIGILSPMQLDYEGKELDKNFKRLLHDQTCYEEDLRKGKLPTLYETERVIGAAMMISRSICQRVGLFDPLYFMYHEESDLCRRARYHGSRIVVVTRSRIFHYHGLVQDQSQQRLPYLFVRNRFFYLWKNPEWSIWMKLKAYLWWGGLTRDAGWPKDLRHRLRVAYIHLWTLFHIPRILWRTRKECRGACYLEEVN